MRLSAWRLVKTKHLSHAWTGEGARLYGGRWNNVGIKMVYTADSLALALLEVLVHLQDTVVLPAYSAIRAEFDERLVIPLKAPELPKNWRDSPAPPETRAMGDRWISDGRSAVLRVPSAVVPAGFTYLINPNHPNFSRIRLSRPMAFPFDPRLRKRRDAS